MTTGITLVFLIAVSIGVPLALGMLGSLGDARTDRSFARLRRAVLPAAIALIGAFAIQPGPIAGLLTLPWLAVGVGAATLALLAAARDERRTRIGRRHAVWAAMLFLAIGAGHAMADRLGISLLGFSPLIVLLTAVHFHVAGVILVTAGLRAMDARGTGIAVAGVAVLIVGMPVTAVGFIGIPIASLVGSIAVASGGLAIGIATLHALPTMRRRGATVLGGVAALSLLLAMPLAVAYAVGTWSGSTWIDLPTMARTHGVLNGLGFAIPAMVAWRIER